MKLGDGEFCAPRGGEGHAEKVHVTDRPWGWAAWNIPAASAELHTLEPSSDAC